jgi:hypothetical protein
MSRPAHPSCFHHSNSIIFCKGYKLCTSSLRSFFSLLLFPQF